MIGYRTPLLPPLDLTVRAGTTLGVLGPNGAGKTALLKSLLGLLPLLGGKRALPLGRSPRVGYVPQRDRLDTSWPLRVLDVVLMGRARLVGPLKRYNAADRDAACAALNEIGVGDLAERPLYALSGGQHQKVLIARAIAAEPEIIIFDEPTTGLAPIMGDVINDLIVKCVKDLGATAISITHDMASARKIADRIARIHKGRIIWNGKASEIDHSGNPFVDQFIHGRAEGPIQMEIRAL